MPFLYVDDERWTSKAREAVGWVTLHKEHRIYDQTGVDIDFKLPYFDDKAWHRVAKCFDLALQLANLSGKETVLDLGAGRGWAAKHFALKGCRVAAIDVVSDDQIGLGRSWALMKEAGTCFDPVIGDSENLPFFPGTFDLVFCAGVLHHTSDLPRVFASVHKVLKPGGRLLAVNEPCISIYENAGEMLRRDSAAELAHGINESRPNYVDYWSAAAGAGFRDVHIASLDTYEMTDAQIEAWAEALRVIPPRSGPLRQRLNEAWELWKKRRRSAAWRRRLPRPRSKRESRIREVFLNVGTDVVLVARR
ncbi:MAG: class I SAM-dependent methyltransferase [bacterium]